jgi:hypothetical protein
MPAELDTMNRFGVSVYGDELAILMPRRPVFMLTHDDALLLAAYLVALSRHGRERFLEVLEAVENA